MEHILPKGYPLEMTDSEIKRNIEYTINEPTEMLHKHNRASQEFFTSIASVGVQELQIRNIEKLRAEIENLQRNNAKSSRWNRILSGLTIILAGVTIFVGLSTLSIAREDIVSDSVWQESQIQELKNQTEKLEEIKQKIYHYSQVNDSLLSKSK